MAVSLVSERATVQDPLNGCADKSSICILHLLMIGQVPSNHLKLDEVGYG